MKIKISEETSKAWRNLLPIEYRVGLSSSLIHLQNLSRTQVGKAFFYHGKKLKLFEEARDFLIKKANKGYLNKKDQRKIKKFTDGLTELEFGAQKAWGFAQDSKYHLWWMDMPGCSCPKMDNRERQGIGYYITDTSCPWHGDFEYLKNKNEEI